MDRRGFTVSVAVGVAGCLGGTSNDADTTTEVEWSTIETVYGDYGHTPMIHVGERDTGDPVTFQLVVEKGRYATVTLENRDTRETEDHWIVYRDDRLDGYDADEHETSPFQTTVDVSSYGEYVLRVATPGNGNEVTVRVA